MTNHGIVTDTIHRSFSGPLKTVRILPHFSGADGDALRERFWGYVDKGAPEACWNWLRSTNDGYGRFKATPYNSLHSHRVAWALHNGKEPTGLVVRHRCDNPRCCNPGHLQIGTHADNMADKKARGRCRTGNQSGSANPRAKLTEEQLATVIDRLKRGLSNLQCAEGLPIGHSMVSKIRTGVMWKKQAEELGWRVAA